LRPGQGRSQEGRLLIYGSSAGHSVGSAENPSGISQLDMLLLAKLSAFQLAESFTRDEEFGQGVSYCVIFLSRCEGRNKALWPAGAGGGERFRCWLTSSGKAPNN